MMTHMNMGYNNLKKNQQTRRLMNKHKSIKDKIIKIQASITFLIRCRNSGVVPKFITNSTKNIASIFGEMRVPKIHGEITKYLEILHNKILRLALKEKHEILKHFQKEVIVIERYLSRLFTVDEMNRFLQYEDRTTASFREKVNRVQKRKFDSLKLLQKREFDVRFNDKWFVNKTNIDIPTNVKWTLSLGQKHGLPIRREEFPMLKIITEGEDFIQTLEGKEDQEIARTRLAGMIDNHLNKLTLSNRDKFMLENVKETKQFLRRNKDVLIMKADKGNTTVALSKQDYDMRINKIVEDRTKYQLIDKDPTNKLQKMNNELVEDLYRNKVITVSEKNRLKTNTAVAPRLYGLPKIHKEDFPLRPICSFINSPSYELCKYMSCILKRITENSVYNVKDSKQFKDRVKDQIIGDDEKLISLDVVSLFPSIPVDLALRIMEEKWELLENNTRMDKSQFLRILKFCIEDNRYFKYNGKIYIQKDGLPMGSPASPIVADIVMEKLLDTCIGKLSTKPRLMTKYVDDLFCLISEDSIEGMLLTFNEFHPNVKFTMEIEDDFKLNYLDTLLIRKDGRLLIDWYQKPTASGRIINYYSKHSRRIIINTAKNLIERVLKISDEQFHRHNIGKIRTILRDNNFPVKVIDRLIGQYKRKNNRDNNSGGVGVSRNVDNRRNIGEQFIYKSMTYIPGISERLEKSRIYDCNRIKMAFRSYNTLGRLFSKTKDKVDKLDMSNIVYKIHCKGNDLEDCTKVYVGTTKNKLRTRIAGHKSDQKYRDINKQRTALTSHCCELNHYPKFENVSVLNMEKNYKRRLILEMLQIINVPITQRINFKSDTESLAHTYRHLIHKNKPFNCL